MDALFSLRCLAVEILAAAAVELFPGTLLVDGGATALGFYYDFQFPFSFQKEFCHLIEERMRAIIKERRELRLLEMVPSNAASFLEHRKQPLRAQKARMAKDPLVALVQMGEFVDLCNPACLSYEGELAFKIQEAYPVPGTSTIRMVGTAFPDKQELKKFLKEAPPFEGRDHLQLGEELDLFHVEEAGCFWHPKGEVLRQTLLDFWKKELTIQGFDFVSTPRQLSGESPSRELLLAHTHFFSSRAWPVLRLAESSFIPSGSESAESLLESSTGFFDREHRFCREKELFKECISSLQFILKISKIFPFRHRLVLCSPPGKGLYLERLEILKEALKECGLEYSTQEALGEVDGPSLELRLQDGLGREWTGPYMGIDCKLNAEKKLSHAVVVQSAFYSLERFVALMVESLGGAFPLWLAPEQMRILPLSEGKEAEAQALGDQLRARGLRVWVDCRKEKLGERMHDALRERVPYSIVVGDREQKSGKVSVRAYGARQEQLVSLEALMEMLNRETEIEN